MSWLFGFLFITRSHVQCELLDLDGPDIRDRQGNTLVAFARDLSDGGSLYDSVGVARLAASICGRPACRSAAFVQGAESLLLAREPHAAVGLYSVALAAHDFFDQPPERARILFCMSMASQEANLPRLSATYLYQARGEAVVANLSLEQFVDPRCTTPQLAQAIGFSAVANGFVDVAELLERVSVVSADFRDRLDSRFVGVDVIDPPAFLPAPARSLFQQHSRGGESWNDALLAQVCSSDFHGSLSQATAIWQDWGILSIKGVVPDDMCDELVAWFGKVVSPNSTMSRESGKQVASFVAQAPALRDFVLPTLADGDGLVSRALEIVLSRIEPFLRDINMASGRFAGLGQASSYAGAAAGSIRRASGVFQEQAETKGVVAILLLTDIPFRGGGTEFWPGAHTMNWAEAAWDGLAFEDLSEDMWPNLVSSVQIAGKRGDCFLAHQSTPSRNGAHAWTPADGLPSLLPTSRWLEISLASGALPPGQRTALHPAHRATPPAFPLEADASASHAASAALAPESVRSATTRETLTARSAVAVRVGVPGAGALADALGGRPVERRKEQGALAGHGALGAVADLL